MDTSGTTSGTRPDGAAGAQAHTVAEEMRQAAREQAGAFWDDAKRTARTKLDAQKDTAARGLGDFASALRNAARELDGEHHDTSANVMGSAADGLARVAESLRGKDLDTLLRDTESFARRQPAMFFAASVAAGFLAVRFLKSSDPGDGASEGSAASTSPDASI